MQRAAQQNIRGTDAIPISPDTTAAAAAVSHLATYAASDSSLALDSEHPDEHLSPRISPPLSPSPWQQRRQQQHQRTCITNRAPFRAHCHCEHPSREYGAEDFLDHDECCCMAARRSLSPAGADNRVSTPLQRSSSSRWVGEGADHRADHPRGRADEDEPAPTLLHRVKHDRSILSLTVSEKYVFAGSQSGEVLIWDIDTYQLVARRKGHSGSVLCLCLTPNHSWLFSSGGDAIVQVWDTETFENIYTIYSYFDVGDVFCVAYSATLQTAWFGAQNTSIQWYDMKMRDNKRPPLTSHPSKRYNRFFDSKGPGGRQTPRPAAEEDQGVTSELLEIDRKHIVQYAHYGYVYCMLVMSAQQIGRGDGEVLLSGGGDGAVKVWAINPKNGAISVLERLESGDSGVLSMTAKDTLLYCGLTDGAICIWDLDTLQLVRTVKAHCDDVLTMSVRGDCIFSGSASGYTRKWNQRFECISRWQAHSGLVLASVVTARNDKLLYITGGNDDCVAIWEVSAFPASSVGPAAGAENDQLLQALNSLISFRTVASIPEYSEECRRAATYLKTLFKRNGAMATLLPTEAGRNPIVFARFSASPLKSPTAKADNKTILFYGHYDVVPAECGSGWKTDPFELTGLNGYLYARGVTDNKGPVLAALFAAAELLQSGQLKSDIVFLIEGEEECGSRGFKDAVQRNKQIIGPVDYVLLANSYWLDDETPCLTYGLRGVIHSTVSIESERPDLHSGVDGSLLNAEPTIQLVSLLSKLTSSDGKVQIPGFYDSVRKITSQEEAMYEPIVKSLDPSSPDLKKDLISKWCQPSLTIHRIDVSGPSSTSIIPRSASATISFRIVPDQDLADVKSALVAYLHANYPGPHNLSISIDHEAEPWVGDPGNEAFRTLEQALRRSWHKDVLFIREGGSIPGIRFLEREFGAPAACLPCGQGSDGAHLDNERMRVENLYKSRTILRDVFEHMGKEHGTVVCSGDD